MPPWFHLLLSSSLWNLFRLHLSSSLPFLKSLALFWGPVLVSWHISRNYKGNQAGSGSSFARRKKRIRVVSVIRIPRRAGRHRLLNRFF